MVFTWRTEKTEGGYTYEVYRVEYQRPSIVVKSGVAPTRAMAVRRAKAGCKEWQGYHEAFDARYHP